MGQMKELRLTMFLGPQGPLGKPLFVHPSKGKTNPNQLYSSKNLNRTTADESDQMFCEG